MDTRSGHIVEDIDEVAEDKKKNYTPIPEDLKAEASAFLNANSAHPYFNLRGNGLLAQWAKTQRTKNRAKNKASRASRKANRK